MSRTNGSISGVSWTMFLLGLASSADTGRKRLKKAKSPRPAMVPAVKARPTKSRRDSIDDMAGLLPGRGWNYVRGRKISIRSFPGGEAHSDPGSHFVDQV